MIATSLVLIGGFLVMLVSRMPGVQEFAALSSATLVAALVGDLVMLPGLLLCFDRWHFGGSRQSGLTEAAAAEKKEHGSGVKAPLAPP